MDIKANRATDRRAPVQESELAAISILVAEPRKLQYLQHRRVWCKNILVDLAARGQRPVLELLPTIARSRM